MKDAAFNTSHCFHQDKVSSWKCHMNFLNNSIKITWLKGTVCLLSCTGITKNDGILLPDSDRAKHWSKEKRWSFACYRIPSRYFTEGKWVKKCKKFCNSCCQLWFKKIVLLYKVWLALSNIYKVCGAIALWLQSEYESLFI